MVLRRLPEARGRRFLVLGAGGVIGLCLVSPWRGGEGQEGSLAWTFRRNRVKSRAVLIRQDGCDWGPSGVKIVCTGLPRVKRTLDFSGIFWVFFPKIR